jgi:ribonuclease HI
MRIHLYTDGGARGNPGPAAIGCVLKKESGEELATYKEFLGEATNNQAEYKALIKGLELCDEYGATHVVAHLDSELVVKQLKQEYRVKDAQLQILFVQAWNAAQKIGAVTFTHIRRALNQEADALVNSALDESIAN